MKFFIRIGSVEKSIDTALNDDAMLSMISSRSALTALADNHGLRIVRTIGAYGLVGATSTEYIDTIWTAALECILSTNIAIQSIESADTPLGVLKATVGGDPEYPEIYVYIKRHDGVEIDLLAAEIKDDGDSVRAYLYGDTTREEYTKTYTWTADEISVEEE